jgi:hypothetical protein
MCSVNIITLQRSFRASGLQILKYCGTDGKLNSKTKFSFFDFLLRYPICLKYILEKYGIHEDFSTAELTSIEKRWSSISVLLGTQRNP